MARERLPERLKAAGRELLATTDALDMQAQGAMWLFDHGLQDWQFYLVTSLVDTIGRRESYRLLLDAFERVDLPSDMTIEDVHLGSPTNPIFNRISAAVSVSGNSQVEIRNRSVNGLEFDGLIYRAVQDVPDARQAELIGKRFAKRVKELPRASRNDAAVHAEGRS